MSHKVEGDDSNIFYVAFWTSASNHCVLLYFKDFKEKNTPTCHMQILQNNVNAPEKVLK